MSKHIATIPEPRKQNILADGIESISLRDTITTRVMVLITNFEVECIAPVRIEVKYK